MALPNVKLSACLGLATAALSFAAAHAAELQVVSSSPAKDNFTTFPKAIRLTFSEPIKAMGADIQLMDPDGRRIRVGAPVAANDSLTVSPQLADGPPVLGPYLVTWKVTSASGQEGQGIYTFFVQRP